MHIWWICFNWSQSLNGNNCAFQEQEQHSGNHSLPTLMLFLSLKARAWNSSRAPLWKGTCQGLAGTRRSTPELRLPPLPSSSRHRLTPGPAPYNEEMAMRVRQHHGEHSVVMVLFNLLNNHPLDAASLLSTK